MLQVFYLYVATVDWDVAHVQWLYTFVSSLCSKCFTCFICMLQVFYLGIAKLDRDVA
jgi:hypothetical protein